MRKKNVLDVLRKSDVLPGRKIAWAIVLRARSDMFDSDLSLAFSAFLWLGSTGRDIAESLLPPEFSVWDLMAASADTQFTAPINEGARLYVTEE